MNGPDLLTAETFATRAELLALLRRIDRANRGGRWTVQAETMGGELVAEVYRFNGAPVFEKTWTATGPAVAGTAGGLSHRTGNGYVEIIADLRGSRPANLPEII